MFTPTQGDKVVLLMCHTGTSSWMSSCALGVVFSESSAMEVKPENETWISNTSQLCNVWMMYLQREKKNKDERINIG